MFITFRVKQSELYPSSKNNCMFSKRYKRGCWLYTFVTSVAFSGATTYLVCQCKYYTLNVGGSDLFRD